MGTGNLANEVNFINIFMNKLNNDGFIDEIYCAD
jgi:hypothetical protein